MPLERLYLDESLDSAHCIHFLITYEAAEGRSYRVIGRLYFQVRDLEFNSLIGGWTVRNLSLDNGTHYLNNRVP